MTLGALGPSPLRLIKKLEKQKNKDKKSVKVLLITRITRDYFRAGLCFLIGPGTVSCLLQREICHKSKKKQKNGHESMCHTAVKVYQKKAGLSQNLSFELDF